MSLNASMKEIPKSLGARYDYLASMSIHDEAGRDIYHGKREEWLTYVKKSAERVFYVISLISESEGARVLEIGAAPYLVTACMLDLLGLEVTAVSSHDVLWPGVAAPPSTRQRTIRVGKTEYRAEEKCFNVEKDLFPVDDGRYGLVLCNEVIEHLLFNPTHMLCEIHRVLSPDGRLILSTSPNMLYWRLAVQLLLNITIEMPYSGDGPYGRHNRLFTPDELRDLAEMNGFDIVSEKVQTFRELRTKPPLIHLLRQATILMDRLLSVIPLRSVRKKAGESITLVCERTWLQAPGFPASIYGSMYSEWLGSQGVFYHPRQAMVNRWCKK